MSEYRPLKKAFSRHSNSFLLSMIFQEEQTYSQTIKKKELHGSQKEIYFLVSNKGETICAKS